MLDDLKLIHERDAQDTLGIAAQQGEQLLHAFELQGSVAFHEVENIVYAAMGGSALAASLVHTWPKVTIPFEVVRDYDLPAYVGPKTLVIAASYSGNTEETLSAIAQAKEKGAQIAVITGGGKLQELAQAEDYLLALLPKAEQPRYAVFYNFRALLDILDAAGVVHEAELLPQLEAAATLVDDAVAAWAPDVPTASNPAKQLALELIGKSVVIYGGAKLLPAAYKWKISFNENAKHVAWVNQIPEFNHNEFIGWSKQPTDKPYAVIDLRSNLEHERTQKRFEVTARLLSGLRPEPFVVEAQGQNILEQVLWTIAYGDFVSLYLGLLNGLNPAPVELVEKFKVALSE
jgi:glucose/mannose-6-phosphate isomerase